MWCGHVGRSLRSWHQPPHVHRGRFVLRLALVLAADRAAGDVVEAVTGILARSADQEMLLLVDHVASVVLAHLEVRRQLDRVRRAGLLAEPAIDAAREVDAEPFGIPPPRLVLGFLQRDAIDGARDRAEIARDAALVAVRVPRQDDPAAKPRGEIRLLLGILDRLPAA